MADRYFRMLRTQTGDLGTFQAGACYKETDENKRALAVYQKRGFTEEIAKEDMDALSQWSAPTAEKDAKPKKASTAKKPESGQAD